MSAKERKMHPNAISEAEIVLSRKDENVPYMNGKFTIDGHPYSVSISTKLYKGGTVQYAKITKWKHPKNAL